MEEFEFRLTKHGFYISKKAAPVFTYLLKGNDESIEKYKEIKGDQIVIDDVSGKPVYFSANRPLTNATLVMRINKDGDAKFHTSPKGGKLPLVTDEEMKYFGKSEGGYMDKLITEQRLKGLLGSNAPVTTEEQEEPVRKGGSSIIE